MTASKLEIVAEPDKPTMETRYVVDAPRALVFEVHTKPQHLKNWWGPSAYELAVCDIDLRVGGRYRFVERDRDGRTFAFIGEYREIVVPEKLVFTLAFEGMADADALQTIRFEEHAGKTTIHSIAVYKSVAARDGHIRNGMEGGMRESYDRMTALLAALPKT